MLYRVDSRRLRLWGGTRAEHDESALERIEKEDRA